MTELKQAIANAFDYVVAQGVELPPDIVAMAMRKGLFAGKTYDYFLSTLEKLIQSVYDGNLGGDFKSILKDLILGQISQAYEQAWQDDDNELPVPEYLRDAAQAAVLDQYEYVDQFYKDIVDSRVDKVPIDSVLSRAALWAGQYNSEYNNAVILITSANGGRLEWVEGDTVDKCDTCLSLNGIVAYASEWEQLGVRPQSAPNDLLTCGGWRCQCTLVPTDKRRSPKAMTTIMNIVQKG